MLPSCEDISDMVMVEVLVVLDDRDAYSFSCVSCEYVCLLELGRFGGRVSPRPRPPRPSERPRPDPSRPGVG